MPELEGKRVFVTGSGAGIGKAIATLFTQRGARVVVSDLNADAAKQTADEIGAAGVAKLAPRASPTATSPTRARSRVPSSRRSTSSAASTSW
jgi:NAD(P)-dependent dehydrogenase (short-subunit alcohol dehydrogenase family)